MGISSGCGVAIMSPSSDDGIPQGVVLVAHSPQAAGHWVRHLNTAIYRCHRAQSERRGSTRSTALCEAVVYTQAIKFKSFDQVYKYYQMSSFGEKKLLRLAKQCSPQLVKFTRRNVRLMALALHLLLCVGVDLRRAVLSRGISRIAHAVVVLRFSVALQLYQAHTLSFG